MLGIVLEAVGAAVLGIEVSVRLEDEVCLSRKPPLRGRRVLEESCLRIRSRRLGIVARRPILGEARPKQHRDEQVRALPGSDGDAGGTVGSPCEAKVIELEDDGA